MNDRSDKNYSESYVYKQEELIRLTFNNDQMRASITYKDSLAIVNLKYSKATIKTPVAKLIDELKDSKWLSKKNSIDYEIFESLSNRKPNSFNYMPLDPFTRYLANITKDKNTEILCSKCNSSCRSKDIKVRYWSYNYGKLFAGSGRHFWCPKDHFILEIQDLIS